jgi:hypothetical protein
MEMDMSASLTTLLTVRTSVRTTVAALSIAAAFSINDSPAAVNTMP